jgi:hypothetical protein
MYRVSRDTLNGLDSYPFQQMPRSVDGLNAAVDLVQFMAGAGGKEMVVAGVMLHRESGYMYSLGLYIRRYQLAPVGVDKEAS